MTDLKFIAICAMISVFCIASAWLCHKTNGNNGMGWFVLVVLMCVGFTGKKIIGVSL